MFEKLRTQYEKLIREKKFGHAAASVRPFVVPPSGGKEAGTAQGHACLPSAREVNPDDRGCLKSQTNGETLFSMSTLPEIEAAAEALPIEDQKSLLAWLSSRVRQTRGDADQGHSVLDIDTVSLGRVLESLDADDDLLYEMLEGRN